MSDDLFADLGLHTSFCRSVAKLGFKQPSEIQSAAIPKVLAGQDVLAIAQTGTGKTAAFGLPLLQQITEIKRGRAKPRCPRSLILAPTRELALQIHDELNKLCAGSNLHFACVIGGVNQNPQVKKLRAGVDVLIAAHERRTGHRQEADRLELLAVGRGRADQPARAAPKFGTPPVGRWRADYREFRALMGQGRAIDYWS